MTDSTDPHAETLRQIQQLIQASQFSLAEQAANDILRNAPGRHDVYGLLGVIATLARQPRQAEAAFRQALELAPQVVEYRHNLAIALVAQQRLIEAAEAARQVLSVRRDMSPTALLWGDALVELHDDSAAVDAYRLAFEFRPHCSVTLLKLTAALERLGQDNEAARLYEAALTWPAPPAEAAYNLANRAQHLRRFNEAEQLYRRAIALRADYAKAWNNLGVALTRQGKLSAAVDALRTALKLPQVFAETWNNLGNALREQGKLDEAVAAYDEAVKLDPAFSSADSNRLFAAQFRPGITLAELNHLHHSWDSRHAAPWRKSWQPHRQARDVNRVLRIGWLSPDLGNHPVGHLLIRTFEALDSREINSFCYSQRVVKDAWSERFQRASVGWRDVQRLDDDALAEQIRRDEIDILIDLAGHTHDHRLLVLARRPAPVQMSYLGYVGPPGLSAIDYYLADRHLLSETMAAEINERTLYLPTVWASYTSPAPPPTLAPLPALATGKVTLASFNNLAKLNDVVLSTWAKILARLPQARLMLKFPGLDDAGVQAELRARLTQAGIDLAQVDLQGFSPLTELFDRYNTRVDLALDPFPFNGGATTLNALSLGVPVVTLPGHTPPGRQTYSLLKTIGVEELIATDLDDYVLRAVALANDLPRLAELRQRVSRQFAQSPLLDGPRLASEFAATLRQAWRAWCEL